MTPKPGVRLDGVCVCVCARVHACICACMCAYIHVCAVMFLLVSMCCDTTQFPLYTLAAKSGGHTDHNNELRLRLLVAESGDNVQNGLRHLQGTVLMVVRADQQHDHLCHQENIIIIIIIIIIKMISRVPIYRTKWEHRALYTNANARHRHTYDCRRGQLQREHGCKRGQL